MSERIPAKILNYIFYGGALFLGVLLTFTWFHRAFFAPVKPGSEEKVPFLVERSWSVKTVAQELEKQNLVRNWWAVYYLALLKKDKLESLKPGEYELSYGYSPNDILRKFINEEIVFHDLVIPEGSSVEDVSNRMAGTTLVTYEQARAALSDLTLLNKLEIPASTFEGYLFPDTYRFSRSDKADLIITTVVKNGEKKRTKEMYNRAIELSMSMHQVLTLASIIEKETGIPSERKLISSVFHNRLRLGMPLQADPTVIYGIKDFDGNLTKEHLLTPTPYNTYTNTGLPPTPICNPGLESIIAALYPAETDFIYFVAKGDGTSIYSATYKEHREAVAKYQGRAKVEAAVERPSAERPGESAQKKREEDLREVLTP